MTVMVAACGGPTPAAAPPRAPIPHPALPSRTTIADIVPGAYRVVREKVIHWPNAAPEVLALIKGSEGSPSIPYVQLVAMQWSAAHHNWNNTWRGPRMEVELSFALNGVPVATVTNAVRTADGEVVGVLSTNDTGDAVDSGAALVWVPVKGTPRLLSKASLANASLRNAVISPSGHALLLSDAVCSDGGWNASVTAAGHPRLTHLTCAQMVDHLPGTVVRFTVVGTGIVKTPVTQLSVSPGTTVVFRPGNAHTAKLVNSGAITFIGQQGNSVYDDQADMLASWAYTVRAAGTYVFAVVTADSTQTPAGGVVPTWVVHVP